MVKTECTHLGEMQEVSPNTDGCEECLVIGDEWVSLRLCLVCGHVGCCDSSKNQHATKHYQQTGHPIVRGYKTKREFRWCYVDEIEV